MFEYFVKTPGGNKNSRFADILVSKDGEAYLIQVGRQTKSGNPISRELKAIQDLKLAGFWVHFIPYN